MDTLCNVSLTFLFVFQFCIVSFIMLTAHLAPVVNSCAMKRCIVRCHVVEDFWSYRAVFGPTLIFVIGISAPLRGLIM
jgi:hypothetical protein